MTPQALEELAISGIPELDAVIPTNRGNQSAVGRELNLVHLVLMSQKSSNGLGTVVGGIPQVHGKVITGRYYPLSNLAIDLGRSLETLLGLLPLALLGGRDILGAVVKVCGPKGMVARQTDVVDPVGMGCQAVYQGALDGVEYPDSLVVRASVDEISSAPSHAGNRALVAAQDVFSAACVHDPNSAGTVLAATGDPRGAVLPQVVRLPRRHQHPLGVALERLTNGLAGLRIPYPDCAIHTAGR